MSSSDESSSDNGGLSEEDKVAAFAVCLAGITNAQFFQANKFRDQKFVDRTRGVIDQLLQLMRMPSLFRTLTNFIVAEWEELCTFVCPIIQNHARSTRECHRGGGRPPKLDEAQHLLNCVLYLKHDNMVVFDSAHWNWAKSSVCDDVVFIASCVNAGLHDEICWPSISERRVLANQVPEFLGCIGIIDGTLCKIQKPFADPQHARWFNGRKKFYSVNNTVVVDHNGLLIYIDPGYPGSFHDVNLLRQSSLMANWQEHFSHTDDYFKFLLGDPGYTGEDQFIMRRMGRTEVSNASNPTVRCIQ